VSIGVAKSNENPPSWPPSRQFVELSMREYFHVAGRLMGFTSARSRSDESIISVYQFHGSYGAGGSRQYQLTQAMAAHRRAMFVGSWERSLDHPLLVQISDRAEAVDVVKDDD